MVPTEPRSNVQGFGAPRSCLCALARYAPRRKAVNAESRAARFLAVSGTLKLCRRFVLESTLDHKLRLRSWLGGWVGGCGVRRASPRIGLGGDGGLEATGRRALGQAHVDVGCARGAAVGEDDGRRRPLRAQAIGAA